MGQETYYTAVIDAGRTNFKLHVRKQERGGLIVPDTVHSSVVRTETCDEKKWGGLKTETAEAALQTTLAELSRLTPEVRKDIRVIPVDSHGASQIILDREGTPIFGTYVYDHDFGETEESFYETCGDPDSLFIETGTPAFPIGLNSLKQIFYLKQKFPEEFEKAVCIVPLSSYIAFVLTGIIATEPSQLRNHSYIQDIQNGGYSSAVYRMGVEALFPPQKLPYEPLGRLCPEIAQKYGLPHDCLVVAVGHDSSAVAFLAKSLGFDDVDSTGTWHVNMSHGRPVVLSPWMQQQGVLYNSDVFGKNLRTTLFRGGQMRQKYLEQRGLPGNFTIKFDIQALLSVLSGDEFLPPWYMDGAGVYRHPVQGVPHVPESLGKSDEKFTTALDLSLSLQGVLSAQLATNVEMAQDTALVSVLDNPGERPLLMCGPSTKDGSFIEIFGHVNPRPTFRLRLEEATSMASHLIGVAAYEHVPLDKLPRERIGLQAENLTPERDPAHTRLIREYAKKWEANALGGFSKGGA